MFDFESMRERYRQLWTLENKTPLLLLRSHRNNMSYTKRPENIKERWCNVDYIVKTARENFENTVFHGDAFPLYNPNLGPDIFGATLGAELVFEENTSYSVPFIETWDEKISFDLQNKWWQKLLEITNALVNESKGDYMVGITDYHTGADALVSIRGPEKLCFDVYDNRDIFNKMVEITLPAYKKQYEILYDITQKNQKGTSNWMGIYCEEPSNVTSCDFAYLISKGDFNELVLPEIADEINYFKGKTVFHLDGVGSLKHLDALLEIEELGGVQWVYGDGQPTARHWIDVLKKIQAKNKIVNVLLYKEDVEPVLSALDPRGLICSFAFGTTADEANEIIALANKYVLAHS